MTYDIGNPTNEIYWQFDRSLSLIKGLSDALKRIQRKPDALYDYSSLIDKAQLFLENNK